MNFTDVDDKTIVGAAKSGLPLREYTDQYITAFREDALALGIEPVEDTPRATDDENLKAMADMINALGERGHTYATDGSIYFKIATLPSYGKLARLDHEGIQSGARDRLRRVRQGERARLRVVEVDQAGRADLGRGLRPRPPRLAHRVLGDGAAAARRIADRHPHRRRRPGVPASRERDRAKRRRDRQGVLALLVPRRAPAGRQPEDVEVARQLLYGPGRARQGLPAVGASLHPAVGVLPQAVELHVDRPGAGGRSAAPHHRFPGPRRSARRAATRTRRSPRASRKPSMRSMRRCATI